MCQTFDGDYGSYLRVDYTISCDGMVYKGMYAFAVLMVLVIPVGVPVLYAVLLLGKRRLINPLNTETREEAVAIREKPGNKDRIAHLEFLYGLYWPQYYYAEVVECVRRLLLTGVPVLWMQGTPTCCAFGSLICIATVVVICSTKPCMDRTNTQLLAAANGAQYLTLFGGLLVGCVCARVRLTPFATHHLLL